MELHTVLCPVDRSDVSKRAFEWALAVARRFGARLNVIEVIDWTLPPVAGDTAVLVEMPPDLQASALEALQRLASPARDAGIATEISVAAGPVIREILARAETVAADLIVMGTHGRGGFERLTLGSVAEKVVRRAACPVLTVPPGSRPIPRELFRTILCATDFSEASRAAVGIAREMARDLAARLVLVHVVHWPFSGVDDAPTAADLRLRLEREADELVARLADETGGVDANIETLVRSGTPRDEILAVVDRTGADLVVMGLSGRNAVERGLLGSTTRGVISGTPCAVLTVRGDEVTATWTVRRSQ
jgi:nucleotide-binding universal stress UspA family protein